MKLLSIEYIPGVDFEPLGIVKGTVVQTKNVGRDFMAGMKNSGKKQDRKSKIESVEVYGNAATAKITLEYPTFYFHDIMSLLKTKDGWKIVSKIFYREMKK